jgi:type VI secretion system protein ImpL
MIDFANTWPYALAAVLLLALVIIILLVVVLRRSAKASTFVDAEELAPQAEPEEPAADEEIVVTLPEAFRRAKQTFRRIGDRDIYEVPLYLMVGGDRARDANLFSNAELDLPWGDAAEGGTHLGMGRGFWFFNRGVVLDLAGSDDKEWETALRLLRELRPKRAADGVIVAFPAADLIEGAGNEIKRAELAANAGRIFRNLWEAQLQIGFRLPVYVMVTGCERLTGFASLCSSLPESARREMLGWSSPYSVDAAYRGAWVDEAFTALVRRVEDVQMEAFAAGTAEADWLLRLPEAIASLGQPVRVCLDNLLKSTAYQGSLIFRGLYFCGRQGLGAAADAKPTGKVAFLADLMEKKIFAEAGLASPTGRTVTARNRSVRIAQTAAILAIVACAGALAWAYFSFSHQDAELDPFLRTAAQRMRRQTDRDEKVEAELSGAAIELLDKMSAVDFRRYGSIFVPTSWFSPFEDKLEHAIGVAFNEVIFHAVDHGLRQKADRLLTDGTFRLEPVAAGFSRPSGSGLAEAGPSTMMSETAALAASPIIPIDQMPEFLDLRRFVENLKQLDEHVTTFDRLAKAGSGDLNDLGEVVHYSLDQGMPAGFYRKGDLYQRALIAADYHAFDRSRYTARAREKLEGLTATFYAALYRRNPFDARLQQLAAALNANAWRQATGDEATRLAEITRRLHALDTALAGPELEWAFRQGSDFNLGVPFNALLPPIERSKFLGPEYAQRVRDAGMRGWIAFRSTLAASGSPLTGSFLAVRDGNPQQRLSEDTLLLAHALDSFVGQQFVVAKPQGRELLANSSRGVRVVWNGAQLDQAMGVAAAYDRFKDKSLTLFPQDLRVSIDQVARDRARAEMDDYLASAAGYVPVPPATGPTMLEEQIRSDITSFGGDGETLHRVLEAFSRLGSSESRRGVANVMTTEGLRLLRGVDDLLDAEQPYRPRLGGFAWWDGSTPPSPSAWGARDVADVAAYAEATRTRITLLARNYAQPLLTWFTKAGTIDRPDVRPVAQRWQGILDDLRDYDAKKPGNSLAALEDYIGPKMAKVSAADCSAAAPPADGSSSPRYFGRSLQQLSRELSRRCNDMASQSATIRYADLSSYFNQRLAGRYPFSDWPQRSGTLEADPADVRGFFRKFDAAKPVIAGAIVDSDPAFAQLRQFLADMSTVRAFFAPFLDSQKPDLAPAYDVEAVFRTAREQEVDADQIIAWTLGVGNETVTSRDKKPTLRWSVGKPVRLTLRWANDAPRVPVLSPSVRGVSVKDRTVVYEYNNQWSLLTALAENVAPAEALPRYDEEEPVTLGFRIFTKPFNGGDTGNVPTQVFMRLALLAPGTPNPVALPRFPHVAPKVEKNIAEGLQ